MKQLKMKKSMESKVHWWSVQKRKSTETKVVFLQPHLNATLSIPIRVQSSALKLQLAIRGNLFCSKRFSSGRNSKLPNEISSALIASLLLELNESDQFFKAPYLSRDTIEEIAYTRGEDITHKAIKKITTISHLDSFVKANDFPSQIKTSRLCNYSANLKNKSYFL